MEQETFEELYNESIKNDIKLEKVVTGKIVKITGDGEIYVDLGYKADGIIPKKEFSYNEDVNPADEFKIGEQITAEILKMNDGVGNVLLSYKRIRGKQDREKLANRVENNEIFNGKINQITEKGIVTEVNNLRIFIPISLSGIRKSENLEEYKGKKITFQIIEFDPENRKIIGSHKIIEDREKQIKEEEFWNAIEVGKEHKGIVVSISNYGVFVDLNGAHGLLHNSEITWRRNADANNYFKVGQEISVLIKAVDRENKKIQLAYAEKELNPWENISNVYKVGDIVNVIIKKFVTFGAFVEMEDGIEGLVHISQISEERILKPEQKLKLGQVVEAKIINLNPENRKIEFSIKEVHSNDWKKDLSNIDGITIKLSE